MQEAENIKPFIDVSLGVMWSAPLGGLKRLWQLPVNHRFQRAFAYHDSIYDSMASGLAPHVTSKPADRELLSQCLALAGENLFYRAEARLFYLMCRAGGKVLWRVEGYPEVIRAIYEAQVAAGVPLTPNTAKFEQQRKNEETT